jgi:hypothetical protein
MSESPPATDAVLLLLLRCGAVAFGAYLLYPLSTLFFVTDADAVRNGAILLVVLLALAGALWWIAPRLARVAGRASPGGEAPTPRAWLVAAFVCMGLWFLGQGLADIVGLPLLDASIRATNARMGFPDASWSALWSNAAGEGVRIAIGLGLIAGAGRLSDWVSRR